MLKADFAKEIALSSPETPRFILTVFKLKSEGSDAPLWSPGGFMSTPLYLSALVAVVPFMGCTRGIPWTGTSDPQARVTVADFVSVVAGLKGFITPGETDPPGKLKDLAPQDALDRLLGSARIYNFDPKESAFDQGMDCIADAMQNLKFKATRTTLVLQGGYDDRACLGSTPVPFESINSIYVAVACTGASFYAFDGKTPTTTDLKGLSADELCPEGNFAILTNNVVEVRAVPPPAPMVGIVPSKKVTTTVMTKDGAACTFVVHDGLRKSLNECREMTIESTVSDSSQTTTTYYAEKYDNLTAQLGGKFFIGGVKKVNLENWSGTVTFIGHNLPPTYEITNGRRSLKGDFGGGDAGSNSWPLR